MKSTLKLTKYGVNYDYYPLVNYVTLLVDVLFSF